MAQRLGRAFADSQSLGRTQQLALSRAELNRVVDRHFGSEVESVLFTWAHLSEVVGLRLGSGQEVVVKAREWTPRLEATSRVHEAAFRAGFPCPEPLVRLERHGPNHAISIERYEPNGGLLPRGELLLSSSVTALVDTLTTLNALPVHTSLQSALSTVPWLDWESGALRPLPDDLAVDLNSVARGDWIDQIGREAARVLTDCELPRVVGHGDFESSNVLFHPNGKLATVHDWDSIVSLPHPCLVGAAALVFPANGKPQGATVEETGRYLRAYQEHHGEAFSHVETQVAWASGTWQLAFNAKKELMRGDSTPLADQLKAQASQRLAALCA